MATIKYFRHQVSSIYNTKIVILRKKWGWEGEAKFWFLNCLIAEADNVRLNISDPVKFEGLCIHLDFDHDRLKEFLDFLLEKDLILKDNGSIYTKDVDDLYNELISKENFKHNRAVMGSEARWSKGNAKAMLKHGKSNAKAMLKDSISNASAMLDDAIIINRNTLEDSSTPINSSTEIIDVGNSNKSNSPLSDFSKKNRTIISKYSWIDEFPVDLAKVLLSDEQKHSAQLRPLRFAIYMQQELLEAWPKNKNINNAKTREWCETIQKMVEVDGRKYKDMPLVFKFAIDDPFWGTVILSPQSFRKHFDKLTVAMSARPTSKENRIIDPNPPKLYRGD